MHHPSNCTAHPISSALHSCAIHPSMHPPTLPILRHLFPPSIHPPSTLPSTVPPVSLGICPSTQPPEHLLNLHPLTSSTLPHTPSSHGPLCIVHAQPHITSFPPSICPLSTHASPCPPIHPSIYPAGQRQPLLGSWKRQRAETQLLVFLLHGAGAGLSSVCALVCVLPVPPTPLSLSPPPHPAPRSRSPLMCDLEAL